jgi:hypothetical protein
MGIFGQQHSHAPVCSGADLPYLKTAKVKPEKKLRKARISLDPRGKIGKKRKRGGRNDT